MIPIKTKEEQEKMRYGGKILAKILEDLKNYSVPGISKREIDNRARRLCLKWGVRPSFLGYQGYPAAICISVNDEVVHGIPDGAILKRGDLVSLDMGVEFENLHTDAALSFICGEAQDNKNLTQKLIQTTERCFYTGVELIKGGVRLGDVSAKIQEVAEKEGFGVIRMLVGHGIGHSVHEEPHVPNYGDTGTGPLLRAGMTLAIEPMLTLSGCVDVVLGDDKWTYKTSDGSVAAHYEHTVLVTHDGYEILTH